MFSSVIVTIVNTLVIPKINQNRMFLKTLLPNHLLIRKFTYLFIGLKYQSEFEYKTLLDESKGLVDKCIFGHYEFQYI